MTGDDESDVAWSNAATSPRPRRLTYAEKMRRIGLCCAALLLLAGLLLVPRRAGAAAEPLETRTFSAYEVDVDGTVRVTIQALVTNRDPSTVRRDAGRVFYYSSAGFAVHDAATQLVARSGETRLAVETREQDEPLRVIAVRFPRNLYFDDAIELTIEYSLSAVRAAQVLVGPQYAFVPAIAQGSRGLVAIRAPADRQVTVSSPHCARTAARPAVSYVCGGSTTGADYQAGGRCAFAADALPWECGFAGGDLAVIPFEATGPGLALSTRSAAVALQNQTIGLSVRHFVGDEAWGARVLDLLRRGLPLLEAANGFPYQGPPSVEIVESGFRDTHGYGGLATSGGRIRLTPVVEDHTILHEAAHLWSAIHGSRWLAEGMADWTANVAARALGVSPETPLVPLPAGPRLEAWGPLRSQLAVGRAERELEAAGYGRSLAFVELLAGRLGASALGRANARIAEAGERGTARSYLDQLEAISGETLAPLFAQWALAEDDVARLGERERVRGAAAALAGRAGAVGITPPAEIDAHLRRWAFAEATGRVDVAAAALDQHERSVIAAERAGVRLGPGFAAAFARDAEAASVLAAVEADAVAASEAALARLGERRPPLARLGLAGQDLNGQAETLRATLARGDYAGARDEAAALERRLVGGRRDGVIRLAVSGIVVVVLCIGVVRLARGRRASAVSHLAGGMSGEPGASRG